MKLKLIILLSLFVFPAIYGQDALPELSSKQEQKANKNADLEIKNLPKKGWMVNRTDITFDEMMHQAWRMKFAMLDPKTPYYIYTFGNGKGNTIEAAIDKASRKAKAQLPGLILMYFNMWNMASDIPQEEKDKISTAIGKAESQINKQLESLDIQPFVNMTRDRKGKADVHLRYYYPQMKVRGIARKIIMNELSKSTKWTKDKMLKSLTYDE